MHKAQQAALPPNKRCSPSEDFSFRHPSSLQTYTAYLQYLDSTPRSPRGLFISVTPLASTIFSTRPTLLSNLDGYNCTVTTSPGWNEFLVQPRRRTADGLPASPAQWETLPSSSFTSNRSMVWGLATKYFV